MTIHTPDWVKHAVFYQIFPDRFARSDRFTPGPGIELKPWGTPPEEQGFQGGNLQGIVDKLDYLQELGITALYLNPIFASAANHRYHTYDYRQVDPLLGGNEALRELLDEAHARQMRVVLDGVFNHASRGFWAFHHILETGPNSPYLDWFIIEDWPLRPYSSDKKHPPNYKCWWHLPALPKLNIKNEGVRRYILQVARHWLEFGIDGWRLDVPTEIKDAAFWQEFRRVVKEVNPEAYLCGEIWHLAPEWLAGDRFDGLMNYPLNRAAFGFFAAETLRTDYKPGGYTLKVLDTASFAERIEELYSTYEWEADLAQLNLLDSHDTGRILWMVDGDRSALHLCVLFQMTMPGAPCVYYGDEVGLTGAGDPYCRAAFPWDEEQWDTGLLAFFKQVIGLRHRYEVLRTGRFRPLLSREGVYGFSRALDDRQAVVIFNANTGGVSVEVAVEGDDGRLFEQVWPPGDAAYRLEQGQLRGVDIPPREAVILYGEVPVLRAGGVYVNRG